MRTTTFSLFALGLLAIPGLASCEQAKLQVSQGMGPNPTLPAPVKSALPTTNTAKAVGWPAGARPTPAAGLQVAAFAEGLDHPRWLYTLPNGDVLAAETNSPPKPDDSKGIKGFFEKKIMAGAGAAAPTANRIVLLRDSDRDGRADHKSVFLAGLNSPFGMTLVGNTLYVADTDAVLRFPYKTGETAIAAKGEKVVDLPAGTINHHWTKNIVASPDGSKLYVSVGSNSNVGENGLDKEQGRAAIWQVDPATGAHRVFASGLRNPVGMAWAGDGRLWASVNERDEIGSDLVPDYMTSVKDGGFYGWPYSYYGRHVDERVKAQRPDLVARATVPDYALGPHTASLGLAMADPRRERAEALPAAFQEGAFVGQHGSWNRKPRSGYKVIFVPFKGARPAGPAVDVLTGFLNGQGQAQGRPVGVTFDRGGALLVADDVGNKVWRVTAAPAGRASVETHSATSHKG